MKRFYLIAAMVTLSGCSAHDAENTFDACKAESMKTSVLKDERTIFQIACMGGNGYDFSYSKECLALRSERIAFPSCFEKRGLIRDASQFFRKPTKE